MKNNTKRKPASRNTRNRNDQNILSTEYHTLIITENNDVKNKKVKNNQSKKNKGPAKYKLYLGNFNERSNDLDKIIDKLWEAPVNSEIIIHINSHGGLVKEGQRLINVIRQKFSGRITTILESMAYSMGALMFCIGDKRIALPYSDLMFHNYSGGVFGKGNEILERVDHNNKHLTKFFKEIILGANALTKKELNLMVNGKDFWFDSKELIEKNICTHELRNDKIIKIKK